MDDQRQKYIDDLRHYFDEKADEYVSACYDGVGRYPSNVYRAKIIMSLIEHYFPDNRSEVSLLDLGCGAGHLLVDLLRCGYRVEGVDMSEAMVALSRKHLREAGFAESLVRQGEIFESFGRNFRHSQYDGVIMAGVLGYLPDPEVVLGNVRNVLKPGRGVLVCDVTNRLFDLFTLNQFSVQFYQWIIDQVGLPAAVKADLSERITALLKPQEIRPIQAKTFQPRETGPKRYFAAQHYEWNPLNYHIKFGQCGFEVMTTRYFHYHPLPTRFEADYPDLMTQLGEALETTEENWLGGLLCSACVMLVQRTV